MALSQINQVISIQNKIKKRINLVVKYYSEITYF
jgi:hypothetical protein